MPKAYEKILTVFGMIMAVVALLGLVVFVSWAQNRHSPLMHTLLGYEKNNQQNQQLVYSSANEAPLSLDPVVPVSTTGGCDCPFCCSSGS